jgi:butyrate kinase
MGNEGFIDDRWYGARYAQSADDNLYQVAGRILSDVKGDQPANQIPSSAVVVVAVMSNHITVQVHIQDPTQIQETKPESVRARVSAICERYNWHDRRDTAVSRYTHNCQVRMVRGRRDAEHIGSLLG